MFLTLSGALASAQYDIVGDFFRHTGVQVVSGVVGFTAMLILLFCERARQTVPLNYVLLAMFTGMETCSLAELTAELDSGSVIMCMASFVICTGSLYLTALYTAARVHLMRNLIFGVFFGCIAQLGFMMLCFLFGVTNWFVAGYAIFGVLITGLYVVIDLI
jgi:hypothetical protein